MTLFSAREGYGKRDRGFLLPKSCILPQSGSSHFMDQDRKKKKRRKNRRKKILSLTIPKILLLTHQV